MKEKRFDREETGAVIEEAARREEAASSSISEETLVEIGKEIGIDEAHLRAAIANGTADVSAERKVLVRHHSGGPTLYVRASGMSSAVGGRAMSGIATMAFCVVALLKSGHSLIALIGIVPFFAHGLWTFLRMLRCGTRKACIEFEGDKFRMSVGHRAISGKREKLRVKGPMVETNLGLRPSVLPIKFVRFNYLDIQMDLGWGLSEGTLRYIVEEVRPYVGIADLINE